MGGINILVFSLFIALTVMFCALIKKEHRWKVILLMSILFYTLLFQYKILLLLLLSILAFKGAHWIRKNKTTAYWVLPMLLLPLILEKMTGKGLHFSISVNDLTNLSKTVRWTDFFQVIGLSYFTFNALSYVIDVKKRFIEPERDWARVMVYLLYFPTLLSGPLHRYKQLHNQFFNIKFTNENFSRGFRLILWGLFKNMVIAERVHFLLRTLSRQEITGIWALTNGFFFFLFLYLNFSSFIDIVQGVSQIFNIKVRNNFQNRIYLAASRQQFWKGWHITLNEWFRDYFFFFLAKYDRKRKYTDWLLLSTFVLIALWHGFTFELLVWGFCNGMWMIIERKLKIDDYPTTGVAKPLRLIYHMFFASVLAMIFISPDIGKTFSNLFLKMPSMPLDFLLGQARNLLIIVVAFGIMDFHYAKAGDQRIDEYLGTYNVWVRWFIYLKLAVLIAAFGSLGVIANYYIRF